MYTYKVAIERVIDGDTVDVHIDLGFNVWIYNRLRLIDIDAPEVRTLDDEEKERGFEAKEYLVRILTEAVANGSDIIIESHAVDKYGRSLATLYIDDMNVNEQMLSEGLVDPYED